jgi:hypothetical protein
MLCEHDRRSLSRPMSQSGSGIESASDAHRERVTD